MHWPAVVHEVLLFQIKSLLYKENDILRMVQKVAFDTKWTGSLCVWLRSVSCLDRLSLYDFSVTHQNVTDE